MTNWILADDTDRYGRHQLAFELVPAGALAAVTGSWLLVAVVGAIVLPAVRHTWVSLLRSGLGVLPSIVVILVAASFGLSAGIAAWSATCAVGLLRRWNARERPIDPAPAG